MPTLNPVFERFVESSPITVMAGGIAARMLHPEQLDEWFEGTTHDQYTRELLFPNSKRFLYTTELFVNSIINRSLSIKEIERILHIFVEDTVSLIVVYNIFTTMTSLVR